MNKISKQFHLKTFVSGFLAKLKSRMLVGSWLVVGKSHGQMVRLSIKPDDQIDETESPSWVNKTGLAKR